MKAKEYDRVRLLVDVYSQFRKRTVPAGTVGTVVYVPDEGEPEAYSVDVKTEGEHDNIDLTPDQFDIIPSGSSGSGHG